MQSIEAKDTIEDPNYQSLQKVLGLAYSRASRGKGLERHATGEPFEDQDIVREGLVFGIQPHLSQIRKKAKEVLRMETPAAQREILDIIVYAAGAYLVLEKRGV